MRAEATAAAAAANAVLEQTGNMSATHLVGQVRSIAYDLLRALDMPDHAARGAVQRAVGPQPPGTTAPEAT